MFEIVSCKDLTREPRATSHAIHVVPQCAYTRAGDL